MKHQIYYVAVLFLFLSACGNPGGISDADYATYKELGAPKILYSCTRDRTSMEGIDGALAKAECLQLHDFRACVEEVEEDLKKPIVDVGYAAGVGMNSTYNKILGDAKADCNGKFEVLDSKS